MRKFTIKQKFWSVAGQFDINDETGQLAYHVQGALFKFPKEFTITDQEGRFVSRIKHRFNWFLPIFTVTLADGQVIRIRKKFTWIGANYTISDFGLEVEGDLWNMNFSLLDEGREAARIHQRWLHLPSTYDLELYDDALADLAISLVVAIDYVKAIEASSASTG
ncbi:MAG: hypothetical protein DI617_00535 [Streptococcus pyogenes]|nr:MAG: hypothetical protein DI617_00535 [Streptococcus pyogenes]